jgi:hypothetical protein
MTDRPHRPEETGPLPESEAVAIKRRGAEAVQAQARDERGDERDDDAHGTDDA